MKDKKLTASGVTLIVCAFIPYLLQKTTAFPSQYMMNWVVSFSMILGWVSYPFSIDTMVGWGYYLSIILGTPLFVLGIILCIKQDAFIFCKKISTFIIIALTIFFGATITVNIAMTVKPAMQPTVTFYFYIITEFLVAKALVAVLIKVKRKNQNIVSLSHAFA